MRGIYLVILLPPNLSVTALVIGVAATTIDVLSAAFKTHGWIFFAMMAYSVAGIGHRAHDQYDPPIFDEFM